MDAGLFENISRADVRWVCGLLARLTDRQLDDAFRAAGYAEELRGRYISEDQGKDRPGRRPLKARNYEFTIYNARMARYTLVYGLRLIPEGSLKGLDEARITLADGSTAGLTLHTFDGTIPQLRRSLDRSLDAFFDLLPGAEEEDLEKFAD